jgi:hypothetical protein
MDFDSVQPEDIVFAGFSLFPVGLHVSDFVEDVVLLDGLGCTLMLLNLVHERWNVG